MEPITGIVTALALGANAGVKSIAERAINDGYAGLKTLIQRKYAKVNIEQFETNPSSKSRREVEEELAAAAADKDPEVLQKAQALLEAIQRLAPQTAAAIGVDLKDVEGASVAIRRITATGTGVKVEKGKFSNDITIEDIQAGRGGEAPKAH
jgi:hypothetical protein